MMAMLGAVLGWEPLFPLLLLASIAGAIVGLIVAARSRDGLQVALPFGVFLGIAFLVVLFFGSDLSALYVRLLLI
jgi:prepilin signal peptidase PulO-like enzyme (type II secretory pathway)